MRGIGAVAGIVMSAVIARTLPVEEAGLFFLAFTIVTILAAVSGLGLNHSLLRFIGAAAADQDWREVNSAYRFAMQYVSMAAIFNTILLWLGADILAGWLSKPDIAPVLRAIAPGLMGLALFALHANALQALHETVRSILILNIITPLGVSFLLLLTDTSQAVWVGWLYTLSVSITLIIALWLWWRHYWVRLPTKLTHTLWHSCMPLWVMVITNQMTIWGGQLIAGFYVDAEQLAFLAVSQRIAILISFVLIVVNLVMAPRFAALWHQKKTNQLARQANLSTWLVASIAIPVVILVFILSEKILLIFGSDYSQADFLLKILVAGQLVNALTGPVVQLLSMTGHEKDIRNTMVFFGLLNLTSVLILTYYYGVLGAAISTAITVSLQNIILVYFVKQRLGFWMLSFRLDYS